jgi:putative spermidine/putrescine transport system permease protein
LSEYVEKNSRTKKKTISIPNIRVDRIFLYGITGLILVFLLVPIIIVPILSFGNSLWLEFPPPGYTLRWYKELFSSLEWLAPIMNSLRIAVPVVILSLIFGIPIAYAIVNGRFRGRSFLNGLFAAPMMIPSIIFAIAIYGVYLKMGLNGTFTGIVIAHVILVLPFVISNVANSLRTLNPAIKQAALSCGAGYFRTFFHITLPLIKNGIIAGAIYAFFISWDEVILGIFLTTPSTETLPIKIWNSLRLDLSPILAAVSTLLIVIATIILIFTTFFKDNLDIEGGLKRKEGDKQ